MTAFVEERIPAAASARSKSAACIDPVTQRMIIAGGASLPGSDAWSLDLTTDHGWAPLTTLEGPHATGHPWPLYTAYGVYDPAHRGMLVPATA